MLGGDLRRTPGGKGANQAVAAARAGGADTALVGALGPTSPASCCSPRWTGAGVRTDLVERVEAPSGHRPDHASIARRRERDRRRPRGELARRARRRAGRARSRAADVVLAQLEIPLDAVLAAAAAAAPEAAVRAQRGAVARPARRAVGRARRARGQRARGGRPGGRRDATTPRGPRGDTAGAGARRGRHARRRGEPGRRGAAAPPSACPSPRSTAVDTTGAGDTYCGVLAAAPRPRRGDLVDAARLAASGRERSPSPGPGRRTPCRPPPTSPPGRAPLRRDATMSYTFDPLVPRPIDRPTEVVRRVRRRWRRTQSLDALDEAKIFAGAATTRPTGPRGGRRSRVGAGRRRERLRLTTRGATSGPSPRWARELLRRRARLALGRAALRRATAPVHPGALPRGRARASAASTASSSGTPTP